MDSASEQAITDVVFELYWSARSPRFREKWSRRIAEGLNERRRFQLKQHMTEWFARQKDPRMREIVVKKKAEYQRQLAQEEQNRIQLAQATTTNLNTINQLKGAIEGVDRILAEADKAAGNTPPERPKLELVPPLPPESPKEGA